MSEFIHGIDLCRLFYNEVVQPVMDNSFPGLPYAAAVIGRGSEVLGFDDEISSDHDWGPHVMLFLDEMNHVRSGSAIEEALNRMVPLTFRGYKVNFRSDGPVPHGGCHHCHCTEILTLPEFLLTYLNYDVKYEMQLIDWLTFPEQKLRSISAGAVYHDEIGLQAFRDRFAYYPHDVWLYLLTAGWGRIAQEEHLMGRACSAGDEIGSAIITSRLVRDLMRLCFLMEKQYAPYPKWFGKAFMELKCARELEPVLRDIQLAQTWNEREKHFRAAWECVSALHNDLGITEPLQITYSNFFTRPYRVCNSGEFGEAIRAQIKDPNLSRLAHRGLFGSIDQMSDNTNIVDNAYWRYVLRKLYEMGSMEHPPDYGWVGKFGQEQEDQK